MDRKKKYSAQQLKELRWGDYYPSSGGKKNNGQDSLAPKSLTGPSAQPQHQGVPLPPGGGLTHPAGAPGSAVMPMGPLMGMPPAQWQLPGYPLPEVMAQWFAQAQHAPVTQPGAPASGGTVPFFYPNQSTPQPHPQQQQPSPPALQAQQQDATQPSQKQQDRQLSQTESFDQEKKATYTSDPQASLEASSPSSSSSSDSESSDSSDRESRRRRRHKKKALKKKKKKKKKHRKSDTPTDTSEDSSDEGVAKKKKKHKRKKKKDLEEQEDSDVAFDVGQILEYRSKPSAEPILVKLLKLFRDEDDELVYTIKMPSGKKKMVGPTKVSLPSDDYDESSSSDEEIYRKKSRRKKAKKKKKVVQEDSTTSPSESDEDRQEEEEVENGSRGKEHHKSKENNRGSSVIAKEEPPDLPPVEPSPAPTQPPQMPLAKDPQDEEKKESEAKPQPTKKVLPTSVQNVPESSSTKVKEQPEVQKEESWTEKLETYCKAKGLDEPLWRVETTKSGMFQIATRVGKKVFPKGEALPKKSAAQQASSKIAYLALTQANDVEAKSAPEEKKVEVKETTPTPKKRPESKVFASPAPHRESPLATFRKEMVGSGSSLHSAKAEAHKIAASTAGGSGSRMMITRTTSFPKNWVQAKGPDGTKGFKLTRTASGNVLNKNASGLKLTASMSSLERKGDEDINAMLLYEKTVEEELNISHLSISDKAGQEKEGDQSKQVDRSSESKSESNESVVEVKLTREGLRQEGFPPMGLGMGGSPELGFPRKMMLPFGGPNQGPGGPMGGPPRGMGNFGGPMGPLHPPGGGPGRPPMGPNLGPGGTGPMGANYMGPPRQQMGPPGHQMPPHQGGPNMIPHMGPRPMGPPFQHPMQNPSMAGPPRGGMGMQGGGFLPPRQGGGPGLHPNQPHTHGPGPARGPGGRPPSNFPQQPRPMPQQMGPGGRPPPQQQQMGGPPPFRGGPGPGPNAPLGGPRPTSPHSLPQPMRSAPGSSPNQSQVQGSESSNNSVAGSVDQTQTQTSKVEGGAEEGKQMPAQEEQSIIKTLLAYCQKHQLEVPEWKFEEEGGMWQVKARIGRREFKKGKPMTDKRAAQRSAAQIAFDEVQDGNILLCREGAGNRKVEHRMKKPRSKDAPQSFGQTNKPSGGGFFDATAKYGNSNQGHNSESDSTVYSDEPDTVWDEDSGQQVCTMWQQLVHCKYADKCSFAHPPLADPARQKRFKYPSRPGQPVCHYFNRQGVCKFRTTCKDDHPKPPGGWEPPCVAFKVSGRCPRGDKCKFPHLNKKEASDYMKRWEKERVQLCVEAVQRTKDGRKNPNQSFPESPSEYAKAPAGNRTVHYKGPNDGQPERRGSYSSTTSDKSFKSNPLPSPADRTNPSNLQLNPTQQQSSQPPAMQRQLSNQMSAPSVAAQLSLPLQRQTSAPPSLGPRGAPNSSPMIPNTSTPMGFQPPRMGGMQPPQGRPSSPQPSPRGGPRPLLSQHPQPSPRGGGPPMVVSPQHQSQLQQQQPHGGPFYSGQQQAAPRRFPQGQDRQHTGFQPLQSPQTQSPPPSSARK